MPQVQPSRLPRSRSSQSLRPPGTTSTPSAATTPAPAPGSHRRQPSLSRPTPTRPGLRPRPKPSPLPSHHPSGSGTSSVSTKSAIPSLGRLRPSPRPPTSSSSSSLSTTKEPPAPRALRPVRSFTTLRQPAKAAEKVKTPVRLTAARTGPPSAKPLVPVRSRPRAATLVENPETPSRGQKVPAKKGDGVKRTPSVSRSPVLGGTKRVAAPNRGESTDSLLPPQPSPPPKSSTRSLIRRPLSLADRVFGGNSSLKIAASKEAKKPAPPPSPSPPPLSNRLGQPRTRPTAERITTSTAEGLRTSLRARRTSNASPTAPAPQPKSSSPTAAKFSPTGGKFGSPATRARSPAAMEKASPFRLPFSKPRTPGSSFAQHRIASTPARGTPATRRTLPDTPALSTFLRDQSTRIGQIGEEDISLASSTSFRALTPPGQESTDLDFVSAVAAQSTSHPSTHALRTRRTSGLRAAFPRPRSPTSPLSPRRGARPIAASTELRAELARLKNERVVLETRIAALEAEEGRLTRLAEAAMRDRQRALDSAESAEVAREAAMWEAVVQAADEAIEEERALKHAIAAARAVVMAM